MPKVPIARPQVQTRGFSTARVSTQAPVEAFGGGGQQQAAANALAGLTGQIAKAVEREKNKADTTNVRINSSDARQLMNDRLRGKGGYLSQRGLSADETKEEFQSNFYKDLDKFDEKFTNDKQRELWAAEKARIRLDFDNVAENHAFRERQVYTEQKLKDSIAIIQDDVTVNYKEDLKIQEGIERQEALINDLADLQGLSPESRKRLLTEGKSRTHASVIAQMLSDNNDRLAKAYFKESSSELTAEDKKRAQSMIDEGSVRGESQRQTDNIMEMGMSQSDALEKARDIKDPEVRDETVRRVRARYAENKTLEEEAQKTLFQESFNKIDLNPSRDAIPPETWTKLSPARQKVLNAWIDKKKRGKDIVTDWVTYYDLKTQASSPSQREQFLRRDLLKERLKLGDSEFKELIKLQAEMRSGSKSAQLNIDGYRTDKQIVDDTLRASGFDLRDKSVDNQKRINNFRAEVDRRVKEEKEKTGKKYIDNERLQFIVDSMLVEGTDPDSGVFGFFQTKKRAFEIEPGAEFELDVDSIPMGEVNKIKGALKRRNMPVNDENIIRLYLQKTQGKR